MKEKNRHGRHSQEDVRPNSIQSRLRQYFNRKRLLYIVCTLLALFLVAAAAFAISSVRDRKQYNRYMDAARQCCESGDYDSALAALRKAASAEKTEECLLLMSRCYEEQGNFDKALEVLRKLNVQKSDIAARINDIENRRAMLKDSEKISVAGKLYYINTTSVVLNGMDLDDSVIDEITKLYSLENLSLENNNITDISALAELGGIVKLDISGNKVRDISALTGLTALRTLKLDANPITDLSPLCSMTSLTSLSITGIEVSAEMLETLKAALPNCAIHSETALEEAQDISFGGVTFNGDVTELDLSGMGIRDISALAGCEKLVKLDLSGNEISDISPLMNLPALEWLDISDNLVSDLKTLMGVNTLTYLDAAGNNITSTSPLSMMTSLQELCLDNNPIHDFSGLRKLKGLKKLGIGATEITEEELVYIEGLKQLTELNIENNDELSGEAVEALQLKINPCNIIHSELVYTVDVAGFGIKSNAAELDLTGRGIEDIGGLQNLPQLETVKLGSNKISNIYILEFTNSRFTIKELDLSSNDIEDITVLSSLQKIEVLNLSNNKISSVMPLMRLSTLKKLYIGGNELTDEQLDELQFALPNCQIYLE